MNLSMKKHWKICTLIVLILATAFTVHYILSVISPTDSALFGSRWYLTDYDTNLYDPHYEFTQMYYCFDGLGNISATITYIDGKTETRDFTYYLADGKNISIGGYEGTYTINNNTLSIYFHDGKYTTLTRYEQQ